MGQRINCEVNNCKYWAEGNQCQADQIVVVSEKGNHAKSSGETDCKTFVSQF